MKYVRVDRWTSEGDSIQVDMLDADGGSHRIELGKECAGALAAALASQLEKLNAIGVEQQFLRPKGLQTGKTQRNEPLLFVTLDGGIELPLVFHQDALDPLISELQKLKGILQPGPEVRWT